MGEPYSDEELLAQTVATPADSRWFATVQRLQSERDDMRRQRDTAERAWKGAEERAEAAKHLCAEARRVARLIVLPSSAATDEVLAEAIRTALAYPEVPA